jgi:hypothetical protein
MDVEAIVWFGFHILSCRSTAKGAPWASFRSLGGLGGAGGGGGDPKTTLGPIGGIETPQTPFFRLYFFCPSLLPCPPGRFIDFPLGALAMLLAPRPTVRI